MHRLIDKLHDRNRSEMKAEQQRQLTNCSLAVVCFWTQTNGLPCGSTKKVNLILAIGNSYLVWPFDNPRAFHHRLRPNNWRLRIVVFDVRKPFVTVWLCPLNWSSSSLSLWFMTLFVFATHLFSPNPATTSPTVPLNLSNLKAAVSNICKYNQHWKIIPLSWLYYYKFWFWQFLCTYYYYYWIIYAKLVSVFIHCFILFFYLPLR